MPGRPVIDTSRPDQARVYDYWLGGKDNFPADREHADRIAALYPPGVPGPRGLATRNRAWLERAVCSAVHDGVTQVLDLGAGYPAPKPLHEVAKLARDTARVAYVDLDPVVVSHGRAAVEGIPGVVYAHGDLGQPGAVMGNPDVRAVIDPGQRTLAVFGLTLQFTTAADARRIIAGWAEWLPSRSRIAVTVASWSDDAVWERVAAVSASGVLHNHAPAQVHAWFRGLDLLGGGIEVARGWGPEAVESPGPGHVLAAVARKP